MKKFIYVGVVLALFVLSACSMLQIKKDVYTNGCCGEMLTNQQKVIILENVMFDWDKDVIREDQKPVIDRVCKTLIDNPNINVYLKGYASVEGESDYNLNLSNRRVEAVKSALVSQGVPESRIVNAIGKGETNFFDLNVLWKNRKVVITSK